MDGFDSKLCLREFWECLDETQRDSLLKINIKDDDDKIQCTACRPCYKAAVLALKEKATETRFEGHANDSDRQTIWVTSLCKFLGVYSGSDAWEGHVVPSKFDTAAAKGTSAHLVKATDDDGWNDEQEEEEGNGKSKKAKAKAKQVGGDDVDRFLRVQGSTPTSNNFVLTSGMACDLVENICVAFDPNDRKTSGGGSNGGGGGGKSGGKKGKKGKKGKGGKKGGGNKSSNSKGNGALGSHVKMLRRSTLLQVLEITAKGNPKLDDRGKPSRQCWYCQDKISLRFLDLLTYPRPVRKFKLLLDPNMSLRDLKILVGKEVNIDPDDVVLLKKGFGRVDGGKAGDYDGSKESENKTIKECDLRWNKLVIISQVPLSLRKTKPNENSNGQNRDEQNKQFVGEIFFFLLSYFFFFFFLHHCISRPSQVAEGSSLFSQKPRNIWE